MTRAEHPEQGDQYVGWDEADFDAANEGAWAAFSTLLSEALGDLEPGRHLSVEVEVVNPEEGQRGAIPYIQALRHDDEIHVEVVSNKYLAPQFHLSRESRRVLRGLGLAKPDGDGLPNYWVVLPLDRVDEAAELLVVALRQAFGVVHPVFLRTAHPGLALLVDPEVPPEPAVPAEEPDDASPASVALPMEGEDIATYPENGDHLQRLIIEALTPMLESTPEPDHDGDIGLRSGTAVVFVSAEPHAPLITIHSYVAVEVQDREAAVVEAGILNRDIPGIQFAVRGGAVTARTALPATPFVPTILRVLVQRMLELIPKVDKDLARRVGGQVFLNEGAAEDPSAPSGADRRILEVAHVDPRLATLLLRDLARPGSLRPGRAARVYEEKPRLLREAIRSCRRAERDWRRRRQQAISCDDTQGAAMFDGLCASSRRVRKSLTVALDRVLARQ